MGLPYLLRCDYRAGAAMTARSFSHLLRAATRRHDKILEGAIARSHLTVQQLAVMEAVRDSGPCSQAAIIKATGIDRSTLSAIAVGLRGRGLLYITRSEKDPRANIVKLSIVGKRTLARVKLERAKADQIFSSRIGGKTPAFLAMLGKIAREE